MSNETKFKYNLREKRKEYKEFLELIENENISELKKKLTDEIEVITENLGGISRTENSIKL